MKNVVKIIGSIVLVVILMIAAIAATVRYMPSNYLPEEIVMNWSIGAEIGAKLAYPGFPGWEWIGESAADAADAAVCNGEPLWTLTMSALEIAEVHRQSRMNGIEEFVSRNRDKLRDFISPNL